MDFTVYSYLGKFLCHFYSLLSVIGYRQWLAIILTVTNHDDSKSPTSNKHHSQDKEVDLKLQL